HRHPAAYPALTIALATTCRHRRAVRLDARTQRGALRSRRRTGFDPLPVRNAGTTRAVPVSSRRGFSWMGHLDAPGPAGPPFGPSSCKGTIMHVSFIATASTLALALSASLPAHAQAAPTELYIDVATHTMPGMPGMGAMGRLAGAMGGQRPAYGMTRHPGMPGRYMDVALHNRNAPGQSATQAVPKGLQLGNRIELLPRERSQGETGGSHDASGSLGLADGGSYRIRYFWGCGEQVRGRQPVEYSMTIRDGKPVQGGRAMAPRPVPEQGPDVGPQHVLWPNPGARRAVS